MTRRINGRLARSLAATILFCLATVARGVLAADTPETIMQRTHDVYGALATYYDTGVVLDEYGAAATPSTSRHSFATYFRRSPRNFLFDFHKQGDERFVIWGGPDAFHTWWSATSTQVDYPNPNNLPAINSSDYQTVGSATKIPTLLYPKAALVGALSHFADPKLDGTEVIAGHPCHRLVGVTSDLYGLTGNEVNRRKLTLWIDVQTLLVRQVREEWQATPGQIHRTTTTFDPTASVAIDDTHFSFVPPRSR
jgi:hypothetical protein